MKLKVIDIHHESERESDYDTAVDLSHWSMQCTSVLFETPGGVRFSVSSRHEQITHSYIEPDFDVMEDTGQTVYLTHADSSRDSSTTRHYFNGLYTAGAHSEITVEAFRKAFDVAGEQPSDVYYSEDLDSDVSMAVARHLVGGSGLPEKAHMRDCGECIMLATRMNAEVSTAEIVRLLAVEADKGEFVEVAISTEFEAFIRSAEARHMQQVQRNEPIVQANRARAACARVQNLIDTLAANAEFEIDASFEKLRQARP